MHLTTLAAILAWLIALAWITRTLAALRGLPRVPDLTLPEHDVAPLNSPSLTVIIPACNEQSAIADSIHSLLAQDYPNLHLIAVNDRSTDATPQILNALAAQHPAKLTVLHVTNLPEGWLGKPHALALAARHALAIDHPNWLLFTDADVLFAPQAIRLSLANAVATHADHFVLGPTPICRTPGEAALLGFLQVMGLWAARPWRVADPKALRDAIGIGAFNLLRASAYTQLGGFESLRMQILEDLTLARRVKLAGLRQRLAFGPGLVRIHWALGARGVVNVMTKNLFAVFHFYPALLLLACAGLTTLWLAPIAALFLPATQLPALLTLLAIATLYRVSSRFSLIPPWTALASPFAAILFLYSLLRSMTITLHDGGVTWRGTFYPLADLRKNSTRLW